MARFLKKGACCIKSQNISSNLNTSTTDNTASDTNVPPETTSNDKTNSTVGYMDEKRRLANVWNLYKANLITSFEFGGISDGRIWFKAKLTNNSIGTYVALGIERTKSGNYYVGRVDKLPSDAYKVDADGDLKTYQDIANSNLKYDKDKNMKYGNFLMSKFNLLEVVANHISQKEEIKKSSDVYSKVMGGNTTSTGNYLRDHIMRYMHTQKLNLLVLRSSASQYNPTYTGIPKTMGRFIIITTSRQVLITFAMSDEGKFGKNASTVKLVPVDG